MIKVLLTGGLGNQMFQYAFARNLSILNNTQLVLNTSYLESKLPFKKWATPMQYELSIFDIKAIVEHNIIQSKYLYPFAKSEYFLRNKMAISKMNVITEQQHDFNPVYLDAKDNTYVKGNFQTEKYFENIKEIIQNDFTFKNSLDELNQQQAIQITQCNSVSIHIRRGDYISLKQNANKFAQIPLSYYNDARTFIENQISNPTYFVFSDDIHWAKENLQLPPTTQFISHNNSTSNSYKDMQLMSMCKHHIICNSTFSWWAAWLNQNKEKIVIAPKNWFADVSINSKDIIPSQWIKL
ncbi:MAG: alpha-1,2-fucosyltransferase [Chitinophagales bacterium]|nr:alpha-1,2-fucosyltransferase [Chitinophagales bacterium]